MKHEWWALKRFGIRHWIAWCLVRLACRIKDTTFFQVIRTVDGSHVIIEADAWGAGIHGTVRVRWIDEDVENDTERANWPEYRAFDDHEKALAWAYRDDESETQAINIELV